MGIVSRRDGWVRTTCFSDDPHDRVGHFSFRTTKAGQVNLHDVNRWLRDTGFKVPPKYTRGGIRLRNPDVGWPSWCVMEGPPPEEYHSLPPRALAELREDILRHEPAKMTPAEIKWIGDLESRMMRGTNTEEDLTARQKFLDEVALRPIDIDEW